MNDTKRTDLPILILALHVESRVQTNPALPVNYYRISYMVYGDPSTFSAMYEHVGKGPLNGAAINAACLDNYYRHAKALAP